MASFFNNYFYLILAIVAGMMMPTQAAINNKLADNVGSPILAAFVSFFIGTIALFLYIMAMEIPLGNLADAKNASLVGVDRQSFRRVLCRFERFARAAFGRCSDF
jgi:hypothetical protein